MAKKPVSALALQLMSWMGLPLPYLNAETQTFKEHRKVVGAWNECSAENSVLQIKICAVMLISEKYKLILIVLHLLSLLIWTVNGICMFFVHEHISATSVFFKWQKPAEMTWGKNSLTASTTCRSSNCWPQCSITSQTRSA